MRTHTVTVTNTLWAAALAGSLVVSGVWFTVEPMPDDRFEITVKLEARALVEAAAIAACR